MLRVLCFVFYSVRIKIGLVQPQFHCHRVCETGAGLVKGGGSMSLLALVAVFGPPIAGLFLGFRVSAFWLSGIFAATAILAFVSVQVLERARPAWAIELRTMLLRLLLGCTWAMATSFVGHAYYSDPWW